MVFPSVTYSVLLVSATDAFCDAVSALLPPAEFFPITRAIDLREAKASIARQDYDLILVNSPLSDGSGLSFCRKLCAETDAGILYLVRREQLEDIRPQAQTFGLVVLGKPLSSPALSQSIFDICCMRERLRGRSKKQQSVEETIEELRVIDRAKWLLIEYLRMTEEDAHRYIGRLAMQQQCSRRQVAENIIRTYAQ